MQDHHCEPDRLCSCNQLAAEPSDNCPVHGIGRKRCRCEKFVKERPVHDVPTTTKGVPGED